MKKCSVCEVEYPEGCYNKKRGKRGGRLSVCIACELERNGQKLIAGSKSQRVLQEERRESRLRYLETKKRKENEWGEGVMAAAGE